MDGLHCNHLLIFEWLEDFDHDTDMKLLMICMGLSR